MTLKKEKPFRLRRRISAKVTKYYYQRKKKKPMEDSPVEPSWEELLEKVNQLYLVLEKINLTQYITYLNNPRRLLLLNFGVGLVRGLGTALGATVLLGLLVMFLKHLLLLNLPVIGGVIGEIMKFVNSHNGY